MPLTIRWNGSGRGHSSVVVPSFVPFVEPWVGQSFVVWNYEDVAVTVVAAVAAVVAVAAVLVLLPTGLRPESLEHYY